MKWFGAGCFVKTTGTMGRDLVLHMNSSASEVLLHRLSWLHGDAHTATPPCFMRVVVEKAVLGGAMEKATLIYFIWDLWVSYFNMMYICTVILCLNYRNAFTGIYANSSCSAAAQLSQAKLYNMMTYDGKCRCLRVAIWSISEWWWWQLKRHKSRYGDDISWTVETAADNITEL